MKQMWTGVLVVTGLVLASTSIKAQAVSPASSRDTALLRSICDETLMVQRMCEMAGERSENSRVKEVCHTVATDYAKTRHQFSDAAQSLGLPVTSVLTPRAARALDKLQNVSKPDFDRAVLHELVKSEQDVLRKVQDVYNGGANPALQQLAASSLSQLRDDDHQVVNVGSDFQPTASTASH
jgi:predicted outer membrane protein